MELCFFKVVLLAVIFLMSVSAVDYDTVAQGYPIGFLSNCPGSWKPAVIKPKSLSRLYLSVMGPGNVLRAKWTPYDYYHAADIAKHPGFDFKKKTFMYVAGYLDATTLPLGRTMGEIYKKLGYNVLILDTVEFTATDFPVAVRFMRPIGFHVAEMLANLTSLGLDPKKLELVGLSLGGQTMSFIAKSYRQITGRNISSLTALDPTGPCFRHLGPGPGSSKPAVIKPKSLKKLYISVMGPGPVLTAKWTPYDYYHVGDIAKHPGFDFKKKTFMYVAGYLDSTTLPVGRTMGEIYGTLGYNVLLLDTVEFTSRYYPRAARNTRPIGLHAAEMLANLTSLGLDPKKLELVGLSLGAEIMSFIAKNYRQMTGRNISSLTGLDAAGPCFRHLEPDQRLDRSDADFVLGITTNMDGFGMGLPYGHITFYVNGGEYQPGETWWLPCTILCSHARSYFLWLSALNNPNTFIGIQCDSIQQARNNDCYDRTPMVTNTMDLLTDKTKPGIYYVATTNSYPYFLGQKGLHRKQDEVLKQIQHINDKDVLSMR